MPWTLDRSWRSSPPTWKPAASRGRSTSHFLSQEEVQRLLAAMEGTTKLMAQITYGAGLRLMECVRLRVKDLDLDQHRLLVRSGKGDKDSSTLLPQGLLAPLRKHLARVKELHERDLAEGHGEIRLPVALGRKYPNTGRDWPCMSCARTPQPSRAPWTGCWQRPGLRARAPDGPA